MSQEFLESKRLFSLLIEADQKLWEAVMAIQENKIAGLDGYASKLMETRGHIHVEFMRPLYKKFPELATLAGMDADDGDSVQ